MVRRSSLLLFLTLLTVPALGAPVSFSPRLLVELDVEAAELARHEGTMPPALQPLATAETRIEPIFTIPSDPDLRASWYDHGLDRWFRLHGVDRAEERVHEVVGGSVLSADLDFIHTTQAIPDDYDIYNMWGLTQMECPEAWDLYQADTDVIVCTIDTGCKISHEDLVENIWINPGEDLNGNGIWDESDINGIDDDNNGYVDDLSGWDFVSIDENDVWGNPAIGEDYGPRDNEVFPDTHGHGTHVMGTAAATTDNGIGVAAASWNAVAMSLRAGFAWLDGSALQGSGFSTDFMAAIQYATENGARVISISFGGPGSQQPYQDVISWARENNVLVFASAGNNGDDARNYPAAYDGAVAVVASTHDDYKAGFSTYGDWVGITAPGTSIWSTMVGENYRPQDYTAWQGTSMASPNAASVAAYVLGYMPELTDDQLELALKASADNIDDINYHIAGLLGAGRVNARRALEFAPSTTVPMMDPLTVQVDRSNGEVTLAWSIDPGDEPGFAGYNVYRDGVLLLEATLDESLVEMLPGPGTYDYTVRAIFDDILSLPERISVTYSGLYGLPVIDDFEADDLTDTWEILRDHNTRTFISRVYEGQQSLGVSSPTDLLDGVQRYFATEDGIAAEYWFQVTRLPDPGGQAAALHLYAGADRIALFVGDSGRIWVQDPDFGLQQLSTGAVDLDQWYHVTAQYLNGALHAFVMKDDGGVFAHQQFSVLEAAIDGVALSSRNLDAGWTFFDAASIQPWPHPFEYYQPVPENTSSYPIVISDGIGTPLPDHELAVLDGMTVVGARDFQFDVYPVVLFAYEDPGTGEGFTPGMPMSFESWRSSTNSATTLYIQTIEQGDGNFGTGSSARITLGTTDVPETATANSTLPHEFALDGPYPNPFNPTTAMTISLPTAADVRVTVYNVLGELVTTLNDGTLPAGRHTVTLRGDDLSSGIYFVRVDVPGELHEIRKLTLLK